MNDYQRIEKVIQYLDENAINQPDLATLSELVGLSPFHFQRMFSNWAGISPKAFLKCLTLSYARMRLDEGASVLDAALDVGLSGSSRLHDLCVTLDAASPGEIKSGGAGLRISVGICQSPFGECLIGMSPRGICHLSFGERLDKVESESLIREQWPNADLVWDQAQIEQSAQRIFSQPNEPNQPLRVFVKGSSFQVRVWRALLDIRAGELTTYGRIAAAIGDSQAARAVGTAVGQNEISFLIPCHRVIRATGVIGNYRWGQNRKKAMIAWEAVGDPSECSAASASPSP